MLLVTYVENLVFFLFKKNMNKLQQEIISLSISKNWNEAKKEWSLNTIFFEKENCLCGQNIYECCELVNVLNQNSCIVGNVCVNKFLELQSDSIFKSVKKVNSNNKKYFNNEALQYSFTKGWINEWELKFYKSIIDKKNLTEKQLYIKSKINKLIVDKIFKIDDSDEKQKSLLKKSLEEVKKDIHSILSVDVLNHVFNEKVVNEWEKSFYLDVLNKKQNYSNIILTEKQKEKINQINKKIIIFLEKPKQ